MTYEWQSPAHMLSRRVYSTPVAVGDHLFVLGGCDVKGTPLDNLEKYDPASNTWTKMESMPTKRAGTCAVAVGKKILAVGGVNTSQTPVDAVEIYDAEKNSWISGDSLPEKLLGVSAVARDGRVVVVGGSGLDTNPKDYLLEYDLSVNKWKKLPPLPTPRYATFSFLVNDRLYVVGGRKGKNPAKEFEMYDFKESRWTKLPDIPSSRVFALYVHHGNCIHSLGGLLDAQHGFTDVSEIFDIDKGEWRISAPMPTKRGDFAAGVVGGRVVVAGGLGNQGAPLKSSEMYDETNDTWTNIGELRTAHSSCAFTVFQDKLYVIGGLSIGGPTCSIAALSAKH